MTYTVVIEKTGNGYSAYVPDLPGCVAAGDTREETEALIQEAVTYHLEMLREPGGRDSGTTHDQQPGHGPGRVGLVSVPEAEAITVSGDTLAAELSDGRTISVPLDWYPRLTHATPEQRGNWRLIGGGEGIHWPDLDEDISVEDLIAVRPPRASSPCSAGSRPSALAGR